MRIFETAIEWEKSGISVGKITAGLFTAGASLLATGVKSSESETIPMVRVAAVTTKRDGMLYTLVQVTTIDGNTIDFRVAHAEAEQARKVISEQMAKTQQQQVTVNLNQSAAPVQPIVMTAPTQPVAHDPLEQLTRLKGLLDAGVVTQEEFEAKKAQLLQQL